MSELSAFCSACNRPVLPGSGHLGIDTAAASAYRNAVEQWEAAYPDGSGTMGSLLEHPEPVEWKIHHNDCEPNTCGYTIDIGDVLTYKGLLWWTAHLLEKSWTTDTDWVALLQQVGEGTDRRLLGRPGL